MNASKENARKAKSLYLQDIITAPEQRFITEFLTAAEAKLPSESAFKRDKVRRKTKASKKD